MKKAILVSREGGESRVCLLVSGKLVNIDTEGPSSTSLVGNIYKGRISDISRGLNAAFVDIGVGKEGFLSSNDIHPGLLLKSGPNPRMGEIFSPGQEILVQVSRDVIGDKGAMLTTCVSLPGRYTVLIPSQERVGISRKLAEDERQRLREILEQVAIPEGFGVIVRTAGQSQKKEELVADLDGLARLWGQIEQRYIAVSAPALLVQEQSVAVRFLRDYLTSDVSEIVVDDEDLHREILGFLDTVMPKLKSIVKLYADRLPLFSRYSVERQVENMFVRDVLLPSGGRIVIDRTEALTAVDVNSGRTRESNIEELALKTNLEAAEEIATQLVLRDLGGLLVIDFIDMEIVANRTKVFNRLKDCCKEDKAKLSFGRISQFGMLEMTRQRLRSGMLNRSTEPCKHCAGVGYHRTTSAESLHIVRKVREMAAMGNQDVITVTAPVPVANFLQNTLRPLLYRLEQEHSTRVVVLGEPTIHQSTVVGAKEAVPAAPVVETKPLDWPATLNGHPGEATLEELAQPDQGEAPRHVVDVVASDGLPQKDAKRGRGPRDAKRDDDRWDSPPKGRRGPARKGGEAPPEVAAAPRGPEAGVPKKPETGKTEGPKRGDSALERGAVDRAPERGAVDRSPERGAADGAVPGQRSRNPRDRGRGRGPNDAPRPDRPGQPLNQAAQRPSTGAQPPASQRQQNPPPLRSPGADGTPQGEKDGFLDSIIKKLLGLDR